MHTYCQSQHNLNFNIGLTITFFAKLSPSPSSAGLALLYSQLIHQISSGTAQISSGIAQISSGTAQISSGTAGKVLKWQKLNIFGSGIVVYLTS